MIDSKPRITAHDMAGFTGGPDRYGHWTRRVEFTEGVHYLAENVGAYWLIDVIASHQPDVRIRNEPFQLWTLTVRADKTCRVDVFRDSGEPPLLFQEIEYTDFPAELAAELKLYCCDGVILLPSEY